MRTGGRLDVSRENAERRVRVRKRNKEDAVIAKALAVVRARTRQRLQDRRGER